MRKRDTYLPAKLYKTDILLPKRLGNADAPGRAYFEFRIFDDRTEWKGTAITLCDNGSRRGWRRGQGGPDAPQDFSCTGKLIIVFYASPEALCCLRVPSFHSSNSDASTSVNYNGCPVGIEVTKLYVTDVRDLLLSVCTLSHAIRKTKKALTWSLVVVLSGSRYMEAPTTPKYPTITRRDAGCAEPRPRSGTSRDFRGALSRRRAGVPTDHPSDIPWWFCSRSKVVASFSSWV